MDPTTLSMAARALRNHIHQHTGIPEENALLGHPSSFDPVTGTDSKLSIYFYKVVPAANSGIYRAAREKSTGNLRTDTPLDTIVHCIITPLAPSTTTGNNTPTRGEMDLRILGQVMQCMHEFPLLEVKEEMNGSEKTVCDVEIIPLELSVDELNKIIPTPPEGGFRPTVAYALSLLPIPLGKVPSAGPEVRVATYGVSPEMSDEHIDFPQQYINAIIKSDQAASTANPWKPQLYVLDRNGRPRHFLQFVPKQDKLEISLLAIGPKTDATLADRKVVVTIEFWSPSSKEFSAKEEKQLELVPNEESKDYRVEEAWELDARLTGQYLLRIERKGEDEELIEGNVCLIVIVRKDAL